MDRRVPPSVHLGVLAVVLIAGGFQFGYASAASRFGDRRRTAVVDAVHHAAPAVASINAYRSNMRVRGAGSGVIVHPSGYVVTNSHVIRGATRIRVQLWQARESIPATLVADDPRGDLALLKLQGNRRWPYVSLAPTRGVIPGETAIAIGNPRGLGDSITVGVISAVRRSAKSTSGGTIKNLIQTDASINTGNSGGPLLNLDGELIGINTSILPSASGIAFAIPADEVNQMLMRALGTCAPRNPLPPEPAPGRGPAFAAPRSASPRPPPFVPNGGGIVVKQADPLRPIVGAAPMQPVNVPLRPIDVGITVADDGARLVIRSVKRGSAAAGAGMRPGDVILDIDGLPVEDLNDVVLAFQASRPGRRYEIRGRRGDHEIFVLLVSPGS